MLHNMWLSSLKLREINDRYDACAVQSITIFDNFIAMRFYIMKSAKRGLSYRSSWLAGSWLEKRFNANEHYNIARFCKAGDA